MNAQIAIDPEISRNTELSYLVNHLDLEVLDGGYAMLDSRWAAQVGSRARELAAMMQSGSWQKI